MLFYKAETGSSFYFSKYIFHFIYIAISEVWWKKLKPQYLENYIWLSIEIIANIPEKNIIKNIFLLSFTNYYQLDQFLGIIFTDQEIQTK